MSEKARAFAEIEKRCFPDPWSEAVLAECLQNELYAFAACGENGNTFAYGCASYAGGEGEILRLAVLPEKRRQGYGERLLDELLPALRKKGAERIFLEVRASNCAAIGLYEKKGFREIGRRKRYYPDGEDAVLMERKEF